MIISSLQSSSNESCLKRGLWISQSNRNIVSGHILFSTLTFLNVIHKMSMDVRDVFLCFQCCEQQKLNYIHVHSIVMEAQISRSQCASNELVHKKCCLCIVLSRVSIYTCCEWAGIIARDANRTNGDNSTHMRA